MRRTTRRLLLLFLLPSLVLAVACSGDDNGAAAATASPVATTSLQTRSAAAVMGTVSVDFTGAPQVLPKLAMPFKVAAGSTAFDAIKMALGEDNLKYQDFGGDLGVFISGFDGVEAEGNHFWEFKLNGESSQVGVSKYEVQDGDVIEFVYSSY